MHRRPAGIVVVLLFVAIAGCSRESESPTDVAGGGGWLAGRGEPAPSGAPAWSDLDVRRFVVPFASGLGSADRSPRGLFLSAHAFGSRAAFDANFPGFPVEDFEQTNAADGSSCTAPGPWQRSSNDVCFSRGDILPGISFGAGSDMVALGDGAFGVPSAVIGPNFFVDDLVITFSDPVCAVGLDLLDPAHPSLDITIRAYGPQNTLLATMTHVDVGFVGLTAAERIARLEFDGGGSTLNAELVDDVAFGCSCPSGVGQARGVVASSSLEIRRKLALHGLLTAIAAGNRTALRVYKTLVREHVEQGFLTPTEGSDLVGYVSPCP